MSEPILVDNTILSKVAKCSTLAVGQQVLGFVPLDESAKLKSGAAAHAAWASYFKGGPTTEILETLSRGPVCVECNGTGVEDAGFAKATCDVCKGLGRLGDLGYEVWANEHVPLDDRLAWQHVSRNFGRWIETHPYDRLPFQIKPQHVEVYFEHPLDDAGEFMFCGIMDGFPSVDQHWYNLENKTTGRITSDWLRNQRLSSQLTGYHWLGEKFLGRPLVGTFLNVQEFSRLPNDPDRKCREHGVKYEECGPLHSKSEITVVAHTREQLNEWHKTALSLAKKYKELLRYSSIDLIQRVRMQGTFNYSCAFCPLSEWCYLGRTPEYANANFVVNRWNPREHAANLVGAES